MIGMEDSYLLVYQRLKCQACTHTFNTLRPEVLDSLRPEVREQLPAMISHVGGNGVDKGVANLSFSLIASGYSLESVAVAHDTYLQRRLAWRHHEAWRRQPDNVFVPAQPDLQPEDFGGFENIHGWSGINMGGDKGQQQARCGWGRRRRSCGGRGRQQ